MLLQVGQHGGRVARIDRPRLSSVVQYPDVVVGEGGDGVQRHGAVFSHRGAQTGKSVITRFSSADARSPSKQVLMPATLAERRQATVDTPALSLSNWVREYCCEKMQVSHQARAFMALSNMASSAPPAAGGSVAVLDVVLAVEATAVG